MKKTGVLTLMGLLMMGLMVWATISGGRVLPSVWAKPEAAKTEAEKADNTKWEYCAIVRTGYKQTIGSGNVPFATVVYYNSNGSRFEDIEAPGKDPLGVALTVLGIHRWEMVGPSSTPLNGENTSNVLFFKRPVRPLLND
jgi:hypothetical protein